MNPNAKAEDEMSEKKITAQEMKDVLDEKRERLEATYTELIDKLHAEKEKLEYDLKHEYRNARRFVRANPEQGVGIAFVSGILIGVLLGKITNER
jgi:ElaB/YqjD/DUF883 family membrane-anchored ribosome-binding protein